MMISFHILTPVFINQWEPFFHHPYAEQPEPLFLLPYPKALDSVRFLCQEPAELTIFGPLPGERGYGNLFTSIENEISHFVLQATCRE